MNKLLRTIKNKTRSERGASLSLALLLFLVCAVLGAVVLTAGTASAGRIANTAEMDRRYYSVTSAAELLADRFSSAGPITIERVRICTETTQTPCTVTNDVLQHEVVNKGVPQTTTDWDYRTVINNGEGSQPSDTRNGGSASVMVDEPTRSFLTSRAVVLLFGIDTGYAICNTDAAFAASMREGHAESGTFRLTHSATGVNASALTVNGEYEMSSGGILSIRLSSDDYELTMRLAPTISESEEITSDTTDTVDRAEHSKDYTEVRTVVTTERKTSTITQWKCETIQ
jgi:hypothetical protein